MVLRLLRWKANEKYADRVRYNKELSEAMLLTTIDLYLFAIRQNFYLLQMHFQWKHLIGNIISTVFRSLSSTCFRLTNFGRSD